MDDWSPSSELVRIRKYLQAITALLVALVGVVGLDVYARLGGSDPIGLVVLAVFGLVFVAGPGYAVYAAMKVDATTAE